jgi:nitrate/TMAO reductase-like tetraheme cytochrome c subunit
VRISTLIPRLWSNWLTILGSIITTAAGFAIVFLVLIGFSSTRGNPYLGLLVIVVLPVMFAIGLLMIPIGLKIEARRGSVPKDSLQLAFEAAFNDKGARRRIVFAVVATLANIGLFAIAGHKLVEHMDSPAFCGTQCHTAMQPEWEAWHRSPHSNVACAECHIGPGASGFVKAKWNGTHQLIGVITGDYHRPTFAGHDKLVASAVTCEQCHAPQRFRPDKIKIFPHYDQDEKNTPKFNAMLLRLGGLNPRTEKYEGIHWHANPDTQIRFEMLDSEFKKIGKVSVYSKGQLVTEFLPPGEPQKALAERAMDCIDCHSRPTHIFDWSPKDAVDRALFTGALDPKVPFIAKIAAEVLGDTSAPREGSEARLKAAVLAAYQKDHPAVKLEPAVLDQTAKTLAQIYLHDVFPDMKLGWHAHPANTGHKTEGLENPGCFRCHDGLHVAKAADGKTKKLGQDCDSCHTGLVFDEDPAKFDDTLAAMVPAAN